MTCAPGTPGRAARSGSVEDPASSGGVLLHAHGELRDVVQSALRTAFNLRTALPDASVEIVLQGGAAGLVVTDEDLTAEVLRAMKETRADVALCHNSLMSLGVDEALHAPAGVLVVPAAVAHLAQRQWQGWAYVRL